MITIYYIVLNVRYMAIAMARILGTEPKNRIRTNMMIEEEFLIALKERNMRLSDTVNVLLDRELSAKKR